MILLFMCTCILASANFSSAKRVLDLKMGMGSFQYPEMKHNAGNRTLRQNVPSADESKDCKLLLRGECSNKIGFYLFTSADQTEGIPINKLNVTNAPFIPNKPIKMIIHGYRSNITKPPAKQIKPAYFATGGQYNIILVDWSKYTQDKCYSTSARNAISGAYCASHLLMSICKMKHSNCDQNLHIIGHSLGAQFAGFIGKWTKIIFQLKVPRISGLDPARPNFSKTDCIAFAISEDDAQFVDMMHSNAGILGKLENDGHVDFYVNGGSFQKHCKEDDNSCNHIASADYFAESITSGNDNNTGFWGYKCSENFQVYSYNFKICNVAKNDEFALMGEHVSKKLRGVYLVETNDAAPFGAGKLQTTGNSVWK